MRNIYKLLPALLVFAFTACKKSHTDTVSNTWQYRSNVYTVAKTDRTIGFGTVTLNAYSDTINLFTRKGLSLTFIAFPSTHITYKLVDYPTANDEMGLYAWDNSNSANNFYSDGKTPGFARVYMLNGKMTVSISNVWMKQATLIDPDSTLLTASFTEK